MAHKKKQYRPYMGEPYKKIFEAIADELNKTSMNRFDDLAAARHCGWEMWRRMFHDLPFPEEADKLRTRYYRDPETLYNPLKP